MTDTSDCESDAGASPSVSSDESADSCSSSPSQALTIVCGDTPTTSKKSPESPVASTSSAALVTTPVSSRKSRKRSIISRWSGSTTPQNNAPSSSIFTRVSRGCQSDNNKTTRKRKRPSQTFTSPEPHHSDDRTATPLLSPASKRKRNKRRRTRSERNIRAGKSGGVTEGEEAVALDAEIDRVLEEKAIKNNLSATNVKSIIRHVITNNLVQKMVMSQMRKKADAGEGGGSSDEDGLVEPKMTRAKAKELSGNQRTPLWAIVDSPMKRNKASETHMLYHHDLPEDSSDEEYLPKDTEIAQSDDECSSRSVTSDAGSPAVPTRVVTRRSVLAEKSPESLFKTPPPRPRVGKPEDSGISRRTRSKHPLTDTALEDLERQLIAPDTTKDMYDFGETDNEDYLAFLNNFLFPAQNDMCDDDEGDPEYNIMEEDEDLHDREEHRMDRAVKVPKKELNELVAELIEEFHVSSGDELEVGDLYSTSFLPFVNDSGVICEDPKGDEPSPATGDGQVQSANLHTAPTEPGTMVDTVDSMVSQNSVQSVPADPTSPEMPPDPLAPDSETPEPLFRACDLDFLHQQMREHVQLLAQSYVLTVSNEDTGLKNIAASSKRMMIELKNFARSTGDRSNFNVINLNHGWTLVNFWPHKFIQQSPIKKKILEEKYIIDAGSEEAPSRHIFPRHIVKVIAENPTFMYNRLLPASFNQKNSVGRCVFTFWEDLLICGGIEELKPFKLSTAQMAELISEHLVVIHPQQQVYHRIRNMKKPGTALKPEIKKYFAEGILPQPDRTVEDVKPADFLPLTERSRWELSPQWISLISHVEDSSAFKWEEMLRKDPVTKAYRQKYGKGKNRKNSDDASSTSTDIEIIDRVFPKGIITITEPNPNMAAIPLLNPNGKAGAVIYVPKYAMNPVQAPQPLFPILEPIEGEEAGNRLATDQKVLTPSKPTQSAGPSQMAQTVITVNVGKPFDLPELTAKNSQVINMSCLETPVKRIIFQKVADQDSKMTPGSAAKSDVSSNVIEEGTEYELSESEFETEPVSCGTPIVITLSSDESNDEPKDGGEVKGTKTSDTKKSDAKPAQGSAVNATPSAVASTSRRSTVRGRGDDSEDEDKKPRKKPMPKDFKGDDDAVDKDKDKNQPKPSCSPPKPPKPGPLTPKGRPKVRKSPNQNTKRASKFNGTPAEKMVQEEPNEFEDVVNAYMESYLAKVQSATESKNPGLYQAFVQMLVDAGEKTTFSQSELHNKVKVLFKEYPELLKEFESFLDPVCSPKTVNIAGHNETMTVINFMQAIEKFTENFPQLKAKIMNKFKSMKDKPGLCEKDIVAALEPLFSSNPVMMNHFKELLPAIYQPQTISSSMDFEEIELELEDAPKDPADDGFELVKLPDETAIPASNTCPCTCHLDTNDSALASRSKHCKKCSLKFQDGRIYIHNGRGMRPVSVELVPVKPKSSAVPGPSKAHHDRPKKDPQPHSSRVKPEFKEPEPCVKFISASKSDGDTHKNDKKQEVPPKSAETHKTQTDEVKTEWTEEEDTVILSTCQQESNMQIAWKKMSEKLPRRSLDHIKNRCAELIALISASEDE